MSENNETHAQIVAEVRDLTKSAKLNLKLGIYGHLPTIYGKPLDVYFAELADRLEAATKLERDAIGNSAKLRKALELALSLIDLEEGCSSKAISQADIDTIKSALAEPARNCDVYDNPYDAADAWPENERCAGRRFHNQSCDGCGYSPARCVSRWLYEKAKGEVQG